jgi:hypothetical protein
VGLLYRTVDIGGADEGDNAVKRGVERTNFSFAWSVWWVWVCFGEDHEENASGHVSELDVKRVGGKLSAE